MVNQCMTEETRKCNGEKTVFSMNGVGKTKQSHAKNETGPLFTRHIKSNSVWVEDLNVRPETIKLLEENVRAKLHDIALSYGFLDLTPKAQATKAKISKQNSTEVKNLRTAKQIIH